MGAVVLLVILVALVYLARSAWSTVEGLLQGIVGGLRLFFRLLAALWHFARVISALLWRFYCWLHFWGSVIGLDVARRLHAAWWIYSYRWRRAYVARHIRKRRKLCAQ